MRLPGLMRWDSALAGSGAGGQPQCRTAWVTTRILASPEIFRAATGDPVWMCFPFHHCLRSADNRTEEEGQFGWNRASFQPDRSPMECSIAVYLDAGGNRFAILCTAFRIARDETFS